KPGAIIPMTNAHNNISEINKTLRIYEVYPSGSSSFTAYEDDGVTESYKAGKAVSTAVHSSVDTRQQATITIDPARGDFDGFIKNKATVLKINVSQQPGKVSARIGRKKIRLKAVNSLEAFNKQSNVYYYDAGSNLNHFATKGSDFEKKVITKNPQ